MPLTLSDVTHIAYLARLDLTPEELETYRGQLSAVLDHFAQLRELDTEDIPPTSSVLPSRTGLREDVPRPGIGAGALQKNAPDWQEDQFKVPPILD